MDKHKARTSSMVGSRALLHLSLVRCCHLAYCDSRRSAIRSRAFDREMVVGSNQVWSLAHGVGLCTSGGSVPMLSARTRQMPTVFIRSLSLHDGGKGVWRNSYIASGAS